MKLIIAYIQPDRLNAVKQALFAREIYKTNPLLHTKWPLAILTHSYHIPTMA